MRHATHLSGGEFRSPRFNLPADALQRLLPLSPGESALPDNHHVPSRLAPRLLVADVAIDVLRPFFHPELHVRFGHGCNFTTMPVPETSAHIDDRLRFGNHDVLSAGETSVAHPVAPTARKQAFAHEQFRQSVFTSDPAHAFMPLFFRELIHSSNSSHESYFPLMMYSHCHILFLSRFQYSRTHIFGLTQKVHQRGNCSHNQDYHFDCFHESMISPSSPVINRQPPHSYKRGGCRHRHFHCGCLWRIPPPPCQRVIINLQFSRPGKLLSRVSHLSAIETLSRRKANNPSPSSRLKLKKRPLDTEASPAAICTRRYLAAGQDFALSRHGGATTSTPSILAGYPVTSALHFA